MSTVSSTTTSQLHAPRWSSQNNPKTQMSDTISSALSAGTLSGTDATALTNALSSIDSSLSADRTASSSTTTPAKLDPSSMKDRIDSLISDQVSSGALTSDQATELTNLFSSHGQSTQTSDAASDDGGLSGVGGPPPGPPPGASGSGGTTDRASSAAPRGSSGASTDDLLSTFIQQLQSSQSGSAGYGAGGTNTGTNISALLFDFQS
jgi:hypothetical protein